MKQIETLMTFFLNSKKKILLLSLVLLRLSCISQTYNPLIEPYKKWQIFTLDGAALCSVGSGGEYFFLGDTIINNVTYNKLYYNLMRASNGSPDFCPPIVVDPGLRYLSDNFLREDTITKKVYIIDDVGIEQVLFDFSLNDSDTLKSLYASCGSPFLIVDSVRNYSTPLGNRKKFYLNNGTYYIEGTTGSLGLFGGFCMPNSNISVCVTLNNVQLYSISLSPLPFNGCSPTVGLIKNNDFHSISLLLKGDLLYFENPDFFPQNLSYCLYSMNGPSIIKRKLSKDKIINIKNVISGLYVVAFFDANYFYYSQKIIIIN